MRRVLEVVSCCALLGAAIFAAGDARGQGFFPESIPAELHLADVSIPAPPQQSAAWKAPDTKLSKEFVSATATLFQQGLADPRGCEYREIEVVVGGSTPPWSDKIHKTHGWVLPDTGKKGQRFGVCWNGLVYPLASIGKRADVRTDTRTAAKADVARAQGITGWYFAQNYEDFCLCHPWEGRAVSHESPLPIKACLLLRLGEAELAEKLWNRWVQGLRSYSEEEGYSTPAESVKVNKPILKDPYLVLANCWTLALYDRAEAAHLRGDDRLALVSAEMLSSVWPAVEAEAVKRGFRKPSDKEDDRTPYFLLHVGRMRELLTDQRRRAKDRRQGVGPPVRCGDNPDQEKFTQALTEQLQQCLDRRHRIALLIREMEEASMHNCGGSPGGGGFGPAFNTLVRRLAAQGESAVEPLLACLESDHRLSRTQHGKWRYPLPVYRFAEPALEEVLKMPFRTFDFPDGSADRYESKRRQDLAARIHAYWERYKDLSPAGRWYNILADDHALPRQWFAAAKAIVQPVCSPVSLDSGFSRFGRRVPTTRKIHGEVLRIKTNPSVAELMAKRVKQHNQPYHDLVARCKDLIGRLDELDEQIADVDGRAPDYLQQSDKLDKQRERLVKQQDELREREYDCWSSVWMGCDVALQLAQWDREAALPVLREQTEICRQVMVEDVGRGRSWSQADERLIQLFVKRADAGDPQALDEYAQWLRQFVGSGTGAGKYLNEKLLEPLWRYPEAPAISAVADWLLHGEDAPCDPLFDLPKVTNPYPDPWKLVRGPLLVSPAFRKQLLRLLADKTQAGVYEVEGDGPAHGNAKQNGEAIFPPDPLRPPPGTKVAYRVCDLYAHHLAALDGTPKCELFWPEHGRDRAVAICAAFLKQYGQRFRPANMPVDVGDGVNMTLPPLLMPASFDISAACKARLAPGILKRPATAEDVRNGDAVFALDEPGSARVCKMPKLPLEARWVTLKDYPFLKEVREEPGGYKKTIAYEQDGMVWQAEEQPQADGRWRRYYGFVGRYGLAKVPAEEIEFRSFRSLTTLYDGVSWSWPEQPLGDGFHTTWTVPGGLEHLTLGSPPVCRIGTPLVCRLRVRNGRGVKRAPPLLVFHRDDVKAPDNAVTVEVRLLYRRTGPYVFPLDEMAVWKEIPSKPSSRLVLKQPTIALGPAETFGILEFDLTDQFDVTRPGIYRVSVRFGGEKAVTYQGDGTEDIGFELLENKAEPAAGKPSYP